MRVSNAGALRRDGQLRSDRLHPAQHLDEATPECRPRLLVGESVQSGQGVGGYPDAELLGSSKEGEEFAQDVG